jgi:WG containing repeat
MRLRGCAESFPAGFPVSQMKPMLLSMALLLAGSVAVAAAAAAATAADRDCSVFSDGAGWIDFTACTRVDASGHRRVTARRLRGLSFDKYGIATVWMSGFYYVGRDGRMVPVVAFDNGADYFAQGLARTQVDGKIGYVDRKLRVVIPPRYDWGFPFADGKAAVCNGCTRKPDGEHWMMVGGRWGTIDRRGHEIEPLQYRSMEEQPK